MSTDVAVAVAIDRPPGAVAAFAMDPANDTAWIGALTEVRLLTPGPLGTGTQVLRVARFLGKRIEYVNEITAFDPPRLLEMRSVRAPFPMTVRYEFAEDGAGTRMRIHTTGEAGGVYRMAAALLARRLRRGVAADLARL